MISFPKIGSLGRTGNQFFQFATMYAYAKRHNHTIAGKWICSYTNRNFGELFNIGYSTDSIIDLQWNEPHFSYKDILKYDPSQHLALNGYFQSEKYFIDFADEIRNVISIGINNPIQENTCSIHIRRGDYLNLQEYHPCPDHFYYAKGIDVMRSKGATKFIVFSDDMDWCRNHFLPLIETTGTSTDGIHFSNPGTDLDDLTIMRSCTHHIIANSSFSWWGAWLSKSENIIAPLKWFGIKGPQDPQDICPENWIRL